MAPNNLHTTHAPDVFNWVWDAATSEWVKETQGSGGGGGGATTIADGADVTQGAKADAAWVSGDGTVISLLKKIASAGGSAVSIADGSDVAEGATTDAAVTTDTTGTVSGKLRGLVKIFSSVWDSTLNRLNAAIVGTTRTSSGTLSVNGTSITIDTTGMATVTVFVTGTTGGFDGTLYTQASNDGGVTWVNCYTVNAWDGFQRNISSIPSASTDPWIYSVAGHDTFRILLSVRTVGTATLSLQASAVPWAFPHNAITIMGSGGNGVTVDGGGNLNIAGSVLAYIQNVTAKAASTAAVATDQALVVAVSPNNTPVLPSGAATSGLQTTGNTSLASIDTKLPALGQALAASSVPVTLPLGTTTSGSYVSTVLAQSLALSGLSAMRSVYATVRVNIGTVPNINFQYSFDNGANWVAARGNVRTSAGYSVGVTFTAPSIADAECYFDLPGGVTNFRLVDVGGTIGTTVTEFIAASPLSNAVLPSVMVGGIPTVQQTTTNVGNNANAWWMQIGDSVRGPVGVKAASVAATGVEPALVVRTVQLPVALAANGGMKVEGVAGGVAVPVSVTALTDRTQFTQVTDGTRDGTVKAASTLPALTDTAFVTTQRDPLPAGTNVIGHVINDTGSTTAVTGTVTVDMTKVAGTATDTNSGVKSAGTLRVVLATDQPALTNKLLVTPDSVALPANQSVNVNQFGGSAVATGTGASGAGVPRVTVANDSNVIVTPPTLTKATQGATGFSTQDLKDAGRTSIAITATVASTATAETLISVNKSSGLAAVAAGSSVGITTGKRLRIQAISISARNSTGTTASNVTVNLRAAVGGATTAASPLQMHFMVALPASTVSTLFPTILIPDGFEIDSNGATNTYGFTITHPQWVTGSVVATFDITLIGYEY